MTSKQASPAFPSLAHIWDIHIQLLNLLDALENKHQGQQPSLVFVAQVQEFILQVQETGKFLFTKEERFAGQSFLDYWTSILANHDLDVPPHQLADFDQDCIHHLSQKGDRFLEEIQENTALMALMNHILLGLIDLENQEKLSLVSLTLNDFYQLSPSHSEIDSILDGLLSAGIVYRSNASSGSTPTTYSLSFAALIQYWPHLQALVSDRTSASLHPQPTDTEQPTAQAASESDRTSASLHPQPTDTEQPTAQAAPESDPTSTSLPPQLADTELPKTQVSSLHQPQSLKQQITTQFQTIVRRFLPTKPQNLLEIQITLNSNRPSSLFTRRKVVLFSLAALTTGGFLFGLAGHRRWHRANQGQVAAENVLLRFQQVRQSTGFVAAPNLLDRKETLLDALAAYHDIHPNLQSQPAPVLASDPVEEKLQQGLVEYLVRSAYSDPNWQVLLPLSVATFTPDNRFAITTVSPDRNRLYQRRSQLWDLHSGTPQPLFTLREGEGFQIIGAAASNNQKSLFTTTKDGIWEIWDVETHQRIALSPAPLANQPPRGYATAITFSGQPANESWAAEWDTGWVAVGSRDGSVFLWQWQGAEQRVIQLGTNKTPDVVTQLMFSPSRQYLVSTHGSGNIRIWDTRQGTISADTLPATVAFQSCSKHPGDFAVKAQFVSPDLIQGISAAGQGFQLDVERQRCKNQVAANMTDADLNALRPLVGAACYYLSRLQPNPLTEQQDGSAPKSQAVCGG